MSFDWYVEWNVKRDWEWGEDEEKGFYTKEEIEAKSWDIRE